MLQHIVLLALLSLHVVDSRVPDANWVFDSQSVASAAVRPGVTYL
jgi:hypothetical protein